MKLLQIISNVLLPVAVLLFASGFFPYKPFIPGLASHDDISYLGPHPPAKFNKLVFMVIDALRSDFVFSNSSGFTFTQQLIRDGYAIPFTAIAKPPTVTLPRIKAITTGSIPSFLDIILNFAESDKTSSLEFQDNWLSQIKSHMKNEGGKLIMYGDDTWLKLFPNIFHRSEGTTSFFVSDFTEVDHNVTRNLQELNNDDWDTMILHYLGLDHIGHKSGPKSFNMLPKQREMDDIIRRIYNDIEQQNHLKDTLFIFCGDHGMNEGGNHGGSSLGEKETALLFLSPNLRNLSPNGRKSPIYHGSNDSNNIFEFYKIVEQIDLTSTITSLLGLPIPRNNLGVLIPDFLPLWEDHHDQLQLLLRNSLQILSILKKQYKNEKFDFNYADSTASTSRDRCESADDENQLLCKWSKVKQKVKEFQKLYDTKVSLKSQDHQSTIKNEAIDLLYDFCKESQHIMSGTASNYNLSYMLAGILLTLISFVLNIINFNFNVDSIIFITITLLYGIMMFASSYIEEEQNFFYWITNAWIIYLYVDNLWKKKKINTSNKSIQLLTFITLTSHRILQRWNQTGQKYSGSTDVVKTLSNYPIILWTLVALTFLMASIPLSKSVSHGIGHLLMFSLILPAAIFKIAFTSKDSPELLTGLPLYIFEYFNSLPLDTIIKIFYTNLIIVTIIMIFFHKSTEAVHSILTIILIIQSRISNVPIFLLMNIQLDSLKHFNLNDTQIIMTSIIFSNTSFYIFGGSNSISSIDLSNAYNGISNFNVVAVGILLFVGNWAGPIWWTSASILKPKPLTSYVTYTTFFTTASLLFTMLACFVLRTHLFIWTVFSPKYLYSMAWTLGFHLLINVVLIGAIMKR